MRLPRGSAFTLLSLATGIVASLAVATSWLPMMQERERSALEDQARELELVAVLAMDRLEEALLGARPPLLVERSLDKRDLPLPAEQVQDVRAEAEDAFGRITDLAQIESIMLVDRQGRLLAAQPARPAALYGDTLNDSGLASCQLDRVVYDRRRVRALFRDERNRPRQVYCLPFREEGQEVLGVLAVVGDAEPVIAASRQSSRELFLLASAAIVTGLVTVAGIRRLLAPLTSVARAAARIAAGERGVRVDARGPQEVQQLARAMNALASAVESREDEIDGRMQVVQQLSSMVAHEVRNPLQSLSLLASLARTEDDKSARDQQLQLIDDEIKVLEGVVQRFLSNSGPLRIVRTPTDLAKVLDRAAAICFPRATDSRVRLVVQAPPHLEVLADGSLLRRALENLLLNAIEFTAGEPGGRVVQVRLHLDDGDAVFVVDDSGPGVPAEERDRIFQPYVTSKAGGTGLGLALVRQVYEAHGGYIRCEPSPLGGARFVAVIPVEPTTRHAT